MFSICPLSALLGVQLLPQPRLRVQRQSAARWFRGRSMSSTGCRVAGPSTLRGACAEGNREDVQCGEQRWQPGMRSYLQASAASAAGNLASNQPAYPVPLTGRGSEEGWRGLDAIEAQASFRYSWPIYSFSKYWTSPSASVSPREEIKYNSSTVREGSRRSL